MNLEDFHSLAKKARSCRRFIENETIPEATIRQMIDIARISPAAGNQQLLRYKIIHETADCQRIFPHLYWARALKDWKGPAEGERPSAYIVLFGPSDKSAATDLGIVAEVLQLAATASGYAACMLGSLDRAKIREHYSIPSESQVLLVVALGKPAETIQLEEMEVDEDRPYWRTKDGVHHVPKRGLDDVLIED